MSATVIQPSVNISVAAPKPQRHINAETELYRLLATFQNHATRSYEFDPSVLKDYVPDQTQDTYSIAALQRHDRQHGVRHYLLSPTSGLSFAKYPSKKNEQTFDMPLALPVKQSLESKIFGYDKDDAPPATLYRAPPNPWMFRVADSPLGINPQRLILRRATAPLNPSDVTVVARSSNPCPAPTSRPTIPLPLRAKHNSVPLAWSAPSTQSSSDYAVLQGSGNKRKALNPPDPRPQKKSPLVSHSPLTAPTRPQKSALHCGIDGCAESFANKTNLQRHQQRHLHSRQRIHCSGCPAVFVRMEHLHAHLSHSAGCTSESAAQLLQSFYLQPEIRAINPTTASQTDLMAYWRRFLEVATVHIAQRKQVG